MSSDEFTDEYKEALKTSIMVENFFDSPVPQKVTKKATKRKSTTYYDSDKGSEDEDYSPTKSKSSTAIFLISPKLISAGFMMFTCTLVPM